MDMSGSTGDAMTEADYQRMSDAMNATISEFPAETAGLGNEELEPTILPDGTKHFELTAAITDWEVAPGKVVQAWTYNGMVPGPRCTSRSATRSRSSCTTSCPSPPTCTCTA